MAGRGVCLNSLLAGKDKLAGGASPDDSGTFAVSCVPIFAPPQVSAPALVLTPAQGP